MYWERHLCRVRQPSAKSGIICAKIKLIGVRIQLTMKTHIPAGPGRKLPPVEHRWNVASRTVLAVVGGYATAAMYTASLSLTLPLPRAQAVMAATLFSFALYCALIIWAYSAETARRAWFVSTLLAALPAGHLVWRWTAT